MGGRAGRVNAVGAMMGVLGLVLLGKSSPETMVFTMVFTIKWWFWPWFLPLNDGFWPGFKNHEMMVFDQGLKTMKCESFRFQLSLSPIQRVNGWEWIFKKPMGYIPSQYPLSWDSLFLNIPSGKLTVYYGKIHHFIAGKIHYFYGHFQ